MTRMDTPTIRVEPEVFRQACRTGATNLLASLDAIYNNFFYNLKWFQEY